jgi:hypothetical protein
VSENLKHEFRNATADNEIELEFENTTRDTFEIFLYWLYERQLPGVLRHQTLPQTASQTERHAKLMKDRAAQLQLVLLWHFADAYEIPDLQAAVMGLIHARMADTPTFPDLIRLFTSGTVSREKFGEPTMLWAVVMCQFTREFLDSHDGFGGQYLDSETLAEIGGQPGVLKHMANVLHWKVPGLSTRI